MSSVNSGLSCHWWALTFSVILPRKVWDANPDGGVAPSVVAPTISSVLALDKRRK
jgi:hypothetical protein